jgi:hypothetical protein
VALDHTEEEEEKGLVVAVADAVVRPRAVVVHAEDARSADRAMMRSRRLGFLAFLTVSRATAFFLDLHRA